MHEEIWVSYFGGMAVSVLKDLDAGEKIDPNVRQLLLNHSGCLDLRSACESCINKYKLFVVTEKLGGL